MIGQEFTLGTIVSGCLNVIIQDVGSFWASFVNMPLQIYTVNVYTYLTGQLVIDNGDLFELVSFEPNKRKLVVKISSCERK